MQSRRVTYQKWNVVQSTIKINHLWSQMVTCTSFRQTYSSNWSWLPLSHSRHMGKPLDFSLAEPQREMYILGIYWLLFEDWASTLIYVKFVFSQEKPPSTFYLSPGRKYPTRVIDESEKQLNIGVIMSFQYQHTWCANRRTLQLMPGAKQQGKIISL